MFPFNVNVVCMPLTYLLNNNNNNVYVHKGKTGYFLQYYNYVGLLGFMSSELIILSKSIEL